jgi:hypothetical protein
MRASSAMHTSIGDRLWNQQVTPQGYGSSVDLYYKHVLEQYKLYVQSADQISARRNLTNTFFLTVQTAFIAAVALAYKPGWHFEPRWLVVFPLVAALILCLAWQRLIRSYRQLNSGKFKVIEEFEKRLPTAPFVDAEWRGALGEGRDPNLYTELTDLEKWVPIAFAILYLLGATVVTFF